MLHAHTDGDHPEWSWLYFFEFADTYFGPDNGVVIEKRAFDVRGNLSAPRLFASRIIKRNDWNVQKRKKYIYTNRLKAFFLAHLVLVLYTINIFECTLYVRKARDIYILFTFFSARAFLLFFGNDYFIHVYFFNALFYWRRDSLVW